MRRSPRRLSVPILVAVSGLLATAHPALAHVEQRAEPAPSVIVAACDRQVCERVLALPPPLLDVEGSATLTGVRCGHFVMTVAGPTVSLTRSSSMICSQRPVATFSVARNAPLPPGASIAMQFVSTPPTPGKPIVRV